MYVVVGVRAFKLKCYEDARASRSNTGTASVKTFRDTMSRLGKVGSDSEGRVDDAAPSSVLKEDEVARTIAMMAATLNGTLDSTLSMDLTRIYERSWHEQRVRQCGNSADSAQHRQQQSDVISTVLREDFGRLNWDLVIRGWIRRITRSQIQRHLRL